MKAVVLEKFATVGLPDVDSPASGSISSSKCGRNWSIAALSQQLINEELSTGLHRLNSRSLDLVIVGNENKIALLNLQAFKLFPSHLATSMISQSLAHHFTADGNLLFGLLPTGDLFVLTDHLQTIKNIRKPYFIKLSSSSTLPWYSRVSLLLSNMVGHLSPTENKIIPAETPSHRILIPSWLPSSHNLPSGLFPFLTALPDGFAILCCLSPLDCFIFVTSYASALRARSIANFKGSSVPGRWQRIIMDKSFIPRWLEEKEQLYFEGRLKSSLDFEKNEVVSGAMIYSALEHTQFHLVYGIINPSYGSFRVSWELIHYELDWALREDSQAINMGSKFVSRLSSDCSKVALVINNHIGSYIHVENLCSRSQSHGKAVKLPRRKMAFCPHGNFDDGTLFFKRECWVSDVQWLVEDGYFAVMTKCGSLSIFHGSGSPMLIKTKVVGTHPDFEEKDAKFYLPVFHPQQISPEKKFPTMKWVDSQQVLSCSSGSKIELFSLKRVFNLEGNDGNEVEVPGTVSYAGSFKDSLTLLFAQAGKNGGLSETDKESEECLGTPSPPFGSGTRKNEDDVTTSAPPTTTEDEAGRISIGRRAPVKYVSVEDDEQDIYGMTTSGELNRTKRRTPQPVSTAEKSEEESSAQPVSRSDYRGSSVADTNSTASEPDTSRSNMIESDEGLPSPSPRGYLSLPHLDLDAPRKRSQVYMADDELSDSPAARRDPVLTPLLPPPPQMMMDHRQPPSSTATFTTTTGCVTTADTYSPPFTSQSIGPTTATEDDDEKVEEKSESQTAQDDEEKTSQSEKEESKLESRTGTCEEDETELEFSEATDVADKKVESVPPTPPPQVEAEKKKEEVEIVKENNSEAEAAPDCDVAKIPTPISPISAEPKPTQEQPENHNDFETKEEEKIAEEVKEDSPSPPSQTSSLTQSSQTQTPVSTRDEHGTQTIRFDTSSGGVSEEERTAATPSSGGATTATKKRCRPFCVITTPPPPSKKNSGTLTGAPRLSPSRIIEVQTEQLEFNKAADDQMAYKTILVPGMISERLRKLTKRRKKKNVNNLKEEDSPQVEEEEIEMPVERTISLSQLSEKVCQEIVDETNAATSDTPQPEEEDGRPCTSQKIWEQAAMQFQQKVGRFVEQKRRRKSTTDVKLFEELIDDSNSNSLEGDENSVKESRSVPNAFSEDAQERLKSILKRGTQKKSKKIVNSLLWLRDAEPAPPQFKGRTLPHDANATSDFEILEELKRRLQMLKYQQDDTKIGRLLSSWALTSSESQLPQLNLQDMMIQPPTVFPLLVEQEKSGVNEEEKAQPTPASSPAKRPVAATKSQPLVTSQAAFIIAGAPSGIKRNKSHHHLLIKKSMARVSAPPPPVPPQSPKKRVRKPQRQQAIYIAPSMKIPTFTIGPPPKPKGKSVKKSFSKAKTQPKAKEASGPTTPTTATTSKPSSTSTRIFVKAQPGKTKITKSPVRSISGLKPRVKSIPSNSAVVQTLTSNRRREISLVDRNTIKKVVFVPASPSSKLFRSNLRKLSIISKKLDAENSRRDGRKDEKITAQKAGSTTTLFRKTGGGEKPSLKIVPEAVEPVFVGRHSKKGGGAEATGKGKAGFTLQLSEADREKLARRVSFSDPIAIVKTVSPTDLNDNSAAAQHLENLSLVIGPGRVSPRHDTKSQFNMN